MHGEFIQHVAELGRRHSIDDDRVVRLVPWIVANRLDSPGVHQCAPTNEIVVGWAVVVVEHQRIFGGLGIFRDLHRLERVNPELVERFLELGAERPAKRPNARKQTRTQACEC